MKLFIDMHPDTYNKAIQPHTDNYKQIQPPIPIL